MKPSVDASDDVAEQESPAGIRNCLFRLLRLLAKDVVRKLEETRLEHAQSAAASVNDQVMKPDDGARSCS